MTNPTNLPTLKSLLSKYSLQPQRKFGQNYLIDESVLDASIESAGIDSDSVVVEIGAGLGDLTQKLAQKAKRVISFEVDPSLRPILQETLAGLNTVELHFADFRAIDLDEILEADARYRVVANLPYNAGTHIIARLMQLPSPPLSITALLQKEVAEKITAQAPHATYLSNFTTLYGNATIERIVPANRFYPAPKVESAILHIAQHENGSLADLPTMSGLLHKGFANPRKKIHKAFTKEELLEASVDESLRPENLFLEDWLRLYEVVSTVK